MTNTLLYVYMGIIGLVLGSFLNVVALRDEKRKSIVTGRSGCPHCGHILQWYDLIPLLSFASQGGKCRYCHKLLSWQYPLAELITAGVVLYVTWYSLTLHHSWALFAGLLVSAALFLVASAVDLRTMELPIDYVVLAGLAGAGGQVASGNLHSQDALLGMIVGAGSLAIVLYGWKLLFKQDGMGSGDIWMAGALGAVAGYPLIFAALLFAVFAGALVGVATMVITRKGLETAVPFGPFLFLGLLFALIWGQSVLQWYIL